MNALLAVNRPTSIIDGLNALLADAFVLYFKTKNFHWHVGGPHFRDYHLLLDEQATQLIATTDVVAERVRKLGGQTLKGVGQVALLRRIADNEAENVTPHDMLMELLQDNRSLAGEMHALHAICEACRDVATGQSDRELDRRG